MLSSTLLTEIDSGLGKYHIYMCCDSMAQIRHIHMYAHLLDITSLVFSSVSKLSELYSAFYAIRTCTSMHATLGSVIHYL